MTHHLTQQAVATDAERPHCVEHGVWVPIPRDPPPGPLLLRLKDVDPRESAVVKRAGIMTFHMTGCTGHFGRPVPQGKVATAMARQIAEPRCFGGSKHAVAPSFFYHLGDIVYKDEDKTDQKWFQNWRAEPVKALEGLTLLRGSHSPTRALTGPARRF